MSQRVLELQAAKAWHLKSPSEWDGLSKEDRAEMLALQEAENVMQSWAIEQNKPKKKGR
jgi:hypothetical protein